MARKKKAAPVEDAAGGPDRDDVVYGGSVIEFDGPAPGMGWEIHPGPVEPGELVIGEGTAADTIIEAAAHPGAEMEIKQAAIWLTKWRNKHA